MKFGHQILKYREDIIRDLTELIAVPSVCTDPVPGKPFGENSAKALETILNMAKKLGLNPPMFPTMQVMHAMAKGRFRERTFPCGYCSCRERLGL